MNGRSLYLGVDGGGTKTEFVCIDDEGEVVAQAVTGTTYHLQVGVDGVERSLREGLGEICRQLSVGPDALDAIFFGLPAYGEDRAIDDRLVTLCGDVSGHARFRCGNDMICGWAGSLACADGINLVAGTGSIGYGERQGVAARAGGWGEVFSDEGSAYWIAIRGLNAFSRMSDGRSERGCLHALLMEALDLETDLDICARVMGEQGMTRADIAGLAHIVSRAAAMGDRAARTILTDAAAELFAIAMALRTRLGFREGDVVPLSWSGGVLANETTVRDAFIALVDQTGGFMIQPPRHSPAYGAALYAKLQGSHLV